jgi:hypothetical protein
MSNAQLALERHSRIPVTVWKFAFEDQQRYFVRGYYAKDTDEPLVDFKSGQIMRRSRDPFRPGVRSWTFVGVERSIFEHLVNVALGNGRLLDNPPEVEPVRDLYSGLSMLRDGPLIGPLSMFISVRIESY